MAVQKEFPRAPELGTGELKVDLGWARAKMEKLKQCLLNLFHMPSRLRRRGRDTDSGEGV